MICLGVYCGIRDVVEATGEMCRGCIVTLEVSIGEMCRRCILVLGFSICEICMGYIVALRGAIDCVSGSVLWHWGCGSSQRWDI